MDKLLSNITSFQIVISKITDRKYNGKWPQTFNTNGHSLSTRPNFGPSIMIKNADDEMNNDLIYRCYYTSGKHRNSTFTQTDDEHGTPDMQRSRPEATHFLRLAANPVGCGDDAAERRL